MKNNALRIAALFLMLALVLGVFAACGDKSGESAINDKSDGNIPGSDPDSGANQPANERIAPDLPEANFNGYMFTFLANMDESDDRYEPEPRELVAEVENAEEPINDAVYKRNEMLKEKYNINFDMVGNTDEDAVLKKTVSSGDETYDAVIIFNNHVSTVVNGGLLTNIANLPYIDLDKPWWDPAVNSMSIDNKQFLLGGDLLILDNEATNALLFNKDLMATLAMDLPYALVGEGKWTMDKMNDYIKNGSSDLNGDGKMEAEDDRWGFVAYRDTMHALLVSGGGTLALKDENDLPYMTLTSPRNLTVIEKIMDIMYDKQNVLNVQSDTTMGDNSSNWLRIYHGAFEENRALFMWVRMRVVEKFRGMDANFGIIPLPKYDENQDNYHSVVNSWSGVLLGVPNSVKDLDRTSIILEAMAAESRYTLQPAYYDVVLQRKFVRDEESSDMLDIIFNSRVYDIGAVYGFGDAFVGFITLCDKSDRNVVSYYEKRQGAMEKAIIKVISVFEDMD